MDKPQQVRIAQRLVMAAERCRTDRAQRAAICRAPDLDQIVRDHNVRRVADLRDHCIDMLDRRSRTNVDRYFGRIGKFFEHHGKPLTILDGRIDNDRRVRRLGGTATEQEHTEQRHHPVHAASTLIRSRPADLAS